MLFHYMLPKICTKISMEVGKLVDIAMQIPGYEMTESLICVPIAITIYPTMLGDVATSNTLLPFNIP